jgi:dethiobiotin synthetase
VAPRFVVVSGTDTGVGKTFVTVALARALVGAGRRVVALKPIESGCADALDPAEDGARLAAATGQASPARAILRLRTPVTPALAADREGVAIDLLALCNAAREHGAGAEVVLVEGAGGLLSPLSWSHDVTDVARALDASVILVASDRLGVLHHTRSAFEVMKARGLPALGVVLSAPAEADASTGTNAEALRRVLPEARIASVPRLLGSDADDRAAKALDPVVAWLSS